MSTPDESTVYRLNLKFQKVASVSSLIHELLGDSIFTSFFEHLSHLIVNDFDPLFDLTLGWDGISFMQFPPRFLPANVF